MSEQTQTLLVTAVYFCHEVPDGADHSGPLLGLAAAVERILHEGLLEAAAIANPGSIDPHLTLESALRLIDEALQGRVSPAAHALAVH